MLAFQQHETEALRAELQTSFKTFEGALYQCEKDWPRMTLTDDRSRLARHVIDPLAVRYGRRWGWACRNFFAHDVRLFTNQAVLSHAFAAVVVYTAKQPPPLLVAVQSSGPLFAVIQNDGSILLEKGFKLLRTGTFKLHQKVDAVIRVFPHTTHIELWDAAARRGPRRLHQNRPETGGES
jgi:hypothetical protein